MAFTKAGINLTGLNNIQPLNLSLNLTPSNILPSMTSSLSSQYGMWISMIVYIGILVILFWAFSDVSPFGTFRYTYMRALLLAILFVNLLSITALSVGFVQSFRLVAIFVILNMLVTMVVLALENQ